MGYYSDVAIKCNANAYNLFKKVWENEYPNIIPDKILTPKNTKNGSYVLQWEWTKWDDEFDDIKVIIGVMNYLDEHNTDKRNYYSYIRVGENYDDVEKRSNNTDLSLFVTREIKW